MASWTDPTRQLLINEIRNRPVIWNKDFLGETNYRTMKVSAFDEVTRALNTTYSTKFTWEDVRAQWKNLKDTFVRKLRWVHEGKYMEDAIKEPTWKFYRMLSFLDDKEAKRLGDSCDHTYELAPTTASGNCGPVVGQRPPPCQQMSYEPASSEEQMLQMFQTSKPQSFTQQGSIMTNSSGVPTSTTTTMATSSNSGAPPKREMRYSPPASNNASPSSGVEEELDEMDDGQPERKKPYRVQMSSIPNMQLITTTASPTQQDEFDHFGGMVAASLRRLSAERGRAHALRVQRRLYDALFIEE